MFTALHGRFCVRSAWGSRLRRDVEREVPGAARRTVRDGAAHRVERDVLKTSPP